MPRPGERVIELFHQLGASVPQATVSDEEFLRIKEYLTRKSGGESIDDVFVTFLRDVLRADAYDGKIISVISGKSFIETGVTRKSRPSGEAKRSFRPYFPGREPLHACSASR